MVNFFVSAVMVFVFSFLLGTLLTLFRMHILMKFKRPSFVAWMWIIDLLLFAVIFSLAWIVDK